MENNKPKDLKIELSPEVARGCYSNFTIITHGPGEFFLDFIAMAPNMPAKVQSRIIMTPENAKNLLAALADNIKKYEASFGEIQRTIPRNNPPSPDDLPNPFFNGGKLN